MGACHFCYRDSRDNNEECVIISSKEDLCSVIYLQGLLRGYIDRRKAVEYSKLKYSKKRSAYNSKTLK